MKASFLSRGAAASLVARWQRRLLSAVGVLLLAVFAGCDGPAATSSIASAPTVQAAIVPVTTVNAQYELAPQTANTTGSTSYLIKVYFSQFGADDVNAVFDVPRFSPTLAVATFSIQSLIAGPTLSERASGYYSELNSSLSGPSSCNGSHPVGGPDFRLSMNMKGTTPEQGTVTVQFCRAYSSSGVGTDGRIKAEITATLKQFTNISKVVILTQNGQCLGDESGQNLCLN